MKVLKTCKFGQHYVSCVVVEISTRVMQVRLKVSKIFANCSKIIFINGLAFFGENRFLHTFAMLSLATFWSALYLLFERFPRL